MTQRRLSRRAIALGLAGGAVHATLALRLGAVVRGRSFRVMDTPETLPGVAFVSVTVLGLVLLGGIPLVLLYRTGLVTPVAGLVVLFTWAFYSSWYYFEEARITGATSVDLYTDSLFGLLWFVPLAIVLLLGVVEYAVRSRFDGLPLGTVFG